MLEIPLKTAIKRCRLEIVYHKGTQFWGSLALSRHQANACRDRETSGDASAPPQRFLSFVAKTTAPPPQHQVSRSHNIAMEALRQLVPLEIFDYPSLLNLRNASTRLLLKDESSHCINVYLIRSLIHLKLSYPDLAASDAYRALNLIDYARERISEWDDDVNFSDVSVSIGDNALRRTLSLLGLEEPEDNSPKLDDLLERCEDVALCLLSRGLRESGCARDAHRFLGQGLNRVKSM